jgi:hypothetical protein
VIELATNHTRTSTDNPRLDRHNSDHACRPVARSPDVIAANLNACPARAIDTPRF